jgi:hypothetical protein
VPDGRLADGRLRLIDHDSTVTTVDAKSIGGAAKAVGIR